MIYEMEVQAREISDELADRLRPAVMRAVAAVYRMLANQIHESLRKK